MVDVLWRTTNPNPLTLLMPSTEYSQLRQISLRVIRLQRGEPFKIQKILPLPMQPVLMETISARVDPGFVVFSM